MIVKLTLYRVFKGKHITRRGFSMQCKIDRVYCSAKIKNVEHTLQNIMSFSAAGYLLVSLVPSTPFRQGFRASHRANREPHLSTEAQTVLHQVYTALLRSDLTTTDIVRDSNC